MGQRTFLELKGTLFEAFVGERIKESFPDAQLIYDKKFTCVYLKKGFTQLDTIVVLPTAIIVVESKSWSRRIVGTYGDYTWRGLGDNPKGLSVVSPVLQNLLHIRFVKATALAQNIELPPVYSLICVPDTCEILSPCKEIIHLSDVCERVQEIVATGGKTYDVMQIVKMIRMAK